MSVPNRSLIDGLSPFKDLTPEELDHIIIHARLLHIVKDVPVFEQAEHAHSFFILLDGYVRVFKTTAAGREVTIRYISPGELMGIAHALGRTTYPASAFAADDCVVLAWPGYLWSEFAAAIPNFGANTYKTVASRLQDVHSRVVEMSTELVEQRVARALLRLIEHMAKRTQEGLLIDFPISRQDIAEMAGTTLHTVSRVLVAWEEKGLVKSRRERITIIEPHRLVMLVEGRAPQA